MYVIFPSPKGPVTMFHCLKALTISQESSIENGMDQPNCNYNWKESTNGRNVQVYYFLFAAAKIVIEKYRHSALQPLIFFFCNLHVYTCLKCRRRAFLKNNHVNIQFSDTTHFWNDPHQVHS